MKPFLKSLIGAFGGTALLASPAAAAVNLTHGDLAVVFYQVVSGVVQDTTYVFDLGQAGQYRESGAYNVSVSSVPTGPASGNIGADLTTAFGANWYNAGTVRWMVVGNVGQTDPLTNGDPSRTSYFSKSVSNLPAGGVNTTIPTLSSTNRGILSNNIEPFFDNTSAAAQTVGANPAGSFVSKATFGSIDEYVQPTTTTNFGVSSSVVQFQAFNSGIIGNQNIAGPLGIIEGALDIYRIIDTTAGADLTSPYSTNGNAAAGTGQFVTRLVINRDGNMYLIPEPSSALLGLIGAMGLVLRRRRA